MCEPIFVMFGHVVKSFEPVSNWNSVDAQGRWKSYNKNTVDTLFQVLNSAAD